MVFLDCRREPVVYAHVMTGRAIQKSCLFRYVRTLGYLRVTTRDYPLARNRNRESYPGDAETQDPVPLATGKLGLLTIFKRTQVSSHFEALKSE